MKNKNILIITHALGPNYGGILQAYALQKTLESLGHSVATSDYHTYGFNKSVPMYSKYLVRLILHIVKPSISNLPPNISRYLSINTQKFISDHIKTVDRTVLNHRDSLQQYDSFVVGSDQVWRSAYVPVEKYLLDFTKNRNVIRISYAASFGRDDLSEYSNVLIRKSVHLAHKFNAISVREDSGVLIVRDEWGLTAEQHVDPTLLLDSRKYKSLIEEDKANIVNRDIGGLFAYVLDHAEGKGTIIKKVADTLGLETFEIMPSKSHSHKELRMHPNNYALPPVTQWLKSFADADFVVTDSFHGCVFSIIFNKPFIAIGNKRRGLTRFTSLLKIFGLEDRLVSDPSEMSDGLLKSKIDWKTVNAIKKKEQKRSFEFLTKHLEVK